LFTAAARSNECFVRVAVERGIERSGDDGGLTYAWAGPAPGVGTRVRVPLGRGGKPASGIVIQAGGEELLGDLDRERVRDVLAVESERLPDDLVALGRWMAGYYVCPLGTVLGGMWPAAVKHGTGKVVAEVALGLGAPVEGLKLSAAARATIEKLRAGPAGTFPRPLRALEADGFGSLAVLRRLAASGVLRVEQQDLVRAKPATGALLGGEAADVPPELSADQQRVVDGILAAGDGFRVHLLRGVTGSGKTEVYLRLLARCLERGMGAVVLVPEIALTPQTAGRFTRRFGGGRVEVLHSGLTAAQRNKAWQRVRAGEAPVVIGARSAVFAPLPTLGLVIVDEEHDSSYKQDRAPRYHGRDVAIKRAQLAGCPAVLGSATPSLESWANTVRSGPGRFVRWTLPTRVGGAQLPDVKIVDLREERRRRVHDHGDDGRLHLLGPTLEQELELTLSRGEQAMLLLNRRGFASYVWCRDAACGFVLPCDQCDAKLVVHRSGDLPPGGIVKCHHCLTEQKVPTRCPQCGGALAQFGGGTQRAEDELIRKFASMGLEEGRTLLRMDSDTMRTAADYAAALGRFAAGEVRVLIGTQMIAKGLDFPGVTLVGVLDADTALSQADFRSAERTFQLVSQVAGRAGRGTALGRVIIQTASPGEPAIQLAAAHDYETFAERELAERTRYGLPPSVRMARVICRDEDASKARTRALGLAERLKSSDVRVHGPAPCGVARIAGQHRIAVDVLGTSAAVVQAALLELRRNGLITSDAKTAVDVDPVSMM